MHAASTVRMVLIAALVIRVLDVFVRGFLGETKDLVVVNLRVEVEGRRRLSTTEEPALLDRDSLTGVSHGIDGAPSILWPGAKQDYLIKA